MERKKFLNGFITKELNGSTLIEAIMAILLIVMIVAASGIVFSNLLISSNLNDKIAAEFLCDKVLVQSVNNQLYISQTIVQGKFVVYSKFSEYENFSDLMLIHVKVQLANGKLLAEQKVIQNVHL